MFDLENAKSTTGHTNHDLLMNIQLLFSVAKG